jgi:hypothetical protein
MQAGKTPKKKHSPGGIDKQFFLAAQNLRAGIFGVRRIHLLFLWRFSYLQFISKRYTGALL